MSLLLIGVIWDSNTSYNRFFPKNDVLVCWGKKYQAEQAESSRVRSVLLAAGRGFYHYIDPYAKGGSLIDDSVGTY